MKVNIIKSDSNSITVTLDGELNTFAAQQFAKDVEPLMGEAGKEITMDFTNLSFISSAGMRTLLLLNKETVAKHGKIIIVGMSEDIRQIFALTGFDQMFEIK